ncbi:MAG: hypothetical protein JMM78_00580 [Candidatus Xiphinematobacter sp.]|nr:MAG: hypothetical protein JMM78_00580 [Candidatus Xiphinematobacter sp.]
MCSDFGLPKLAVPEESWHRVARAWLQKTVPPGNIQRWVDFHNHPTSQMHPERWGSAALEWRIPILGCPLAQAYVDEHFRNLWNWGGDFWTSPESPLMQLAISELSFLRRLAAFSGALIAVREIRKTIDSKKVLELRRGLGEGVLNFAYTTTLHSRVSVPQKCRLQQWSRSDSSPTTVAVLNSGWLLIACACALLPAEEWNRFLSRLPHSVEKDLGQRNFSSEDSQLAWWCLRELVRVTVQEKGDEHVQIS